MPETVIAVDGKLEAEVVETDPTEIDTSVTHDAPWLPHDFTCSICEPEGDETVASTDVL